MLLLPGSRIGPYEIVAPLGAGGMGEVYRARDARLDRDGAIKIRPAHVLERYASNRLIRPRRWYRPQDGSNRRSLRSFHPTLGAPSRHPPSVT